ncbi:MAG: FAD-dependent oxidoreductase, partial [Flavobacteriaceae bacterium]
GVIGLCSAYYLHKEGHQISIVDQSNLDSGASYVNAGYLSPSHIIPLSAPGVMKKGLKWMFDSSSPLYIKPRLNLDFLQWVWAFNKSCTQKHVNRSIPVIKDISLLSQELFDEIKRNEHFNFHYKKRGLFMLCKTNKVLDSEIKTARLAKNEGLKVRELNLNELQELEPNVKIDVVGATFYECDYHITPGEFMQEMKVYLESVGVHFFKGEKVEDLNIQGKKINSIKTNKQILRADEFVLAAGSWSSLLSKKIGLKLLLQAGKGYRINTKTRTGVTIPAILTEAKVAVTPMHGFTRFAGTMEIAGINHNINKTRVETIAKATSSYYPDIKLSLDELVDAKCGLRPVSPDGLPYIGKSEKCINLIIATGHAMMNPDRRF